MSFCVTQAKGVSDIQAEIIILIKALTIGRNLFCIRRNI
jgi:hypothetical protein